MKKTVTTICLVSLWFLTSSAVSFAQYTAVDNFGRGTAKQMKGDLEGAIADYTRAIELNPMFGEAYCNRGNAKSDKGDLDGAIADFSRAIVIKPGLSEAYCGRGLAKSAKGDLNGATADLNQAIDINPKFSEAYYGLAACHALKSKWNDALSDYRRTCEISKQGDVRDYCQLQIWIMRTRLGEGKAADKDLAARLKKGWNAAPNDWVSKVAGHLLGAVTEPDLIAATHSSNAQTAGGQLCEAWYYAGMKKLLTGDKKAAAENFRKCLATKHNDFNEFKFAQAELKALGGP